ncbi:flocculation-associated PEP-CTERM protein PepA [Salinimonas sediminis]|uniref:Flocculation-associated PEP-CTERM protein PepA n=1 Tax=Salinimonas sediminis TaxID=2303538 RepID=A0A346NI66_9ALTE|nr:flocculation-associated PEP-CTERM protein PepA [Salinimonas sediminis]AXR05223.1 flocculation-associated PEP-CTERM protein PepA [Salinimonas sediminis]
MKIKTLVKSLALTAGIAASFSSYADFVEFTVDESSVAAGGASIDANKINGGYVENLTFDGAGNFEADAFATFGLFYNNGRVVKGSGLNSFYTLYATFSAEGSVTPNANGFTFEGTEGGFQFFMDPSNDTAVSDFADLSLSNTGDDYLLGSSSSLGANLGSSVTANGVTTTSFNFDFFNFELTAEGDQYFVSPQPFSMKVNVNGDFDSFNPAGSQSITGDVSAQFYEVPEPSTLAVLALGLLGLGASSRRKA